MVICLVKSLWRRGGYSEVLSFFDEEGFQKEKKKRSPITKIPEETRVG
jgi:hypothetical protein